MSNVALYCGVIGPERDAAWAEECGLRLDLQATKKRIAGRESAGRVGVHERSTSDPKQAKKWFPKQKRRKELVAMVHGGA